MSDWEGTIDGDLSEEKIVKKRQKKAKLEAERALEDMRQLLAASGNRAFLWRLLTECGVYRTNSEPDQGPMAFREGRRSIGLWILNEMLAARSESYTLMRDEASDREKRLTTS